MTLFKPELIPKIINKEKTQTRRLMKPEHYVKEFVTGNWQTRGFAEVGIKGKNGKIKTQWKVGQDYSVQPGRGKCGVKFCSKCGFHGSLLHWGGDCPNCKIAVKPLRHRITKIRKQRLLDISNSDAKKEGFHDKHAFLEYVFKLYGKLGKHPSLLSLTLSAEKKSKWNPWMLALSFEVVK